MLKKLALLFLTFSLILSCNQDKAPFALKIKPNKKYFKKISISSRSEVNFKADKETLAEIESYGYKLPILTESTLKMETKITTKKRNKNGIFIAVKEYGDVLTTSKINDQYKEERKPYSGMTILGRYNDKNDFTIDSIVGIKLTPELYYLHTVVTENTYKKIKFPSKRINVGDTIFNEEHITIPIQGMNAVYIIIKKEYVLKEINNNKAFFILKQKTRLDPTWDQENITMNGLGFGKTVYDIKENQLIDYSSELPIDLTIKINEKMTAKIKIIMTAKQTVKIE